MGQEDRSSKRGFASMDPERKREISRKGGESVPPEQRSFSKNRELARAAGRKGGQASGGNAANLRAGRARQTAAAEGAEPAIADIPKPTA